MKMLKLQEMFPDEKNFSFLQNKYEKQPSRGFLGKSVWKYAANLQENTRAKVWEHLWMTASEVCLNQLPGGV